MPHGQSASTGGRCTSLRSQITAGARAGDDPAWASIARTAARRRRRWSVQRAGCVLPSAWAATAAQRSRSTPIPTQISAPAATCGRGADKLGADTSLCARAAAGAGAPWHERGLQPERMRHSTDGHDRDIRVAWQCDTRSYSSRPATESSLTISAEDLANGPLYAELRRADATAHLAQAATGLARPGGRVDVLRRRAVGDPAAHRHAPRTDARDRKEVVRAARARGLLSRRLAGALAPRVRGRRAAAAVPNDLPARASAAPPRCCCWRRYWPTCCWPRAPRARPAGY